MANIKAMIICWRIVAQGCVGPLCKKCFIRETSWGNGISSYSGFWRNSFASPCGPWHCLQGLIKSQQLLMELVKAMSCYWLWNGWLKPIPVVALIVFSHYRLGTWEEMGERRGRSLLHAANPLWREKGGNAWEADKICDNYEIPDVHVLTAWLA